MFVYHFCRWLYLHFSHSTNTSSAHSIALFLRSFPKRYIRSASFQMNMDNFIKLVTSEWVSVNRPLCKLWLSSDGKHFTTTLMTLSRSSSLGLSLQHPWMCTSFFSSRRLFPTVSTAPQPDRTFCQLHQLHCCVYFILSALAFSMYPKIRWNTASLSSSRVVSLWLGRPFALLFLRRCRSALPHPGLPPLGLSVCLCLLIKIQRLLAAAIFLQSSSL